MKIILITGHGGAVGAKTATAGIVSSLRAQGIPVLALDLCPANLLRLHFGMNPEDGNGIARQILDNSPLENANYRNRNGIDFLPFGTLTREGYQRLLAYAEQHPDWMNPWLARLDLPAETCLVCHAPLTSHALWRPLLGHARQLELFALDALTLLRMKQAVEGTQWLRATDSWWVVNGFDATCRLDRDAELVVRARYKNRLVPVTLHHDENHREALAQYSTIHAYAPSSQGAHDMTALALWLTRARAAGNAA